MNLAPEYLRNLSFFYLTWKREKMFMLVFLLSVPNHIPVYGSDCTHSCCNVPLEHSTSTVVYMSGSNGPWVWVVQGRHVDLDAHCGYE